MDQAAPMGRVNMLAIRRDIVDGWRHTLACGIGSVAGDLTLFCLVLLGGHYVFSDLSNPAFQTVLAAIGVVVLLSAGDLLPCPRRRGTPAGLRQRPALGRKHRPRASGHRC